jgi:hypothetical protein
MIQYRTERAALCEFRKRISWYAKYLNPCPKLREDMRLINSSVDFERAIDDFLEWRRSPRLMRDVHVDETALDESTVGVA